MVDIAVNRQLLVGMAVQTVCRIGTQSYRVFDLLPRAVMAGGAGTGTVGGNIMLGALYLRPARHHMTLGAQRAGRIIGKVTGTYCHGMCMAGMKGLKNRAVARRTVATRGEVLANSRTLQAAVTVMAAGAAVMNLGITSIGQWRRIGVTACT